MTKYTKYHSNYIFRKKHQNINGGTIYERDWVTTGGKNNFGKGKTIYYNNGNFVFTRNNTNNYPNKHRLSSTENIWNYEDVKDATPKNNKIKDNNKTNDIRDFVYYGSCVDLITTSVENIIREFPGAIFSTDEKLCIPPLDAKGQFEYIDNEYIINNQFDIDLYHKEVILEEHDNPLRWLTCSTKYFTINGRDIKVYKIETFFDKDCPSHEQWDYRKHNNYKNINIIKVTINNTFVLKGYRVNDDIVFTSSAKHLVIKPKEEYIQNYFNSLNGFEKLLLDRNTTPFYSINLITPVEGKLSYYYVEKTYTWPSNDYCIDIQSANYEEFIDDIYNLGQSFDDMWTDNIYRNMTHEAIKNFDWTYTREYSDGENDDNVQGGERMQRILRYCGRVFDNIKNYIDGIKATNTLTYNNNSNMSSSKIREKLELNGWDLNSIIPNVNDNKINVDDISIDSDFLTKNNLRWFPNKNPLYTKVFDYNNAFNRKLLLSSKYIIKNKGTLNSIHMLMGLFGLGDDDYSLNEKYYQVSNISEKSTDRIKELNSKRNITVNYDDNDEYWGLPVKEINFSDGNFAVPFFDTKKETDKQDFYFQSKGGWGKYMPAKVTNDNGLDYSESLSYLRVCDNVKSLYNISQNDIIEGDICYVYNLNDYTEVTGDEKKLLSHYFVSVKKDFTFYWSSVDMSLDNDIVKKARYLEKIITTTTGNNPHVGYGKYDLGKYFIENMEYPFKNLESDVFNGLDDDDVNLKIFTLNEKITNKDTDDNKIKILAKEHIISDNDGNTIVNLFDSKVRNNDSKDNYFINSKVLIIKNTLKSSNYLYTNYFRQIILPFVMQIIPSTTILILQDF